VNVTVTMTVIETVNESTVTVIETTRTVIVTVIETTRTVNVTVTRVDTRKRDASHIIVDL
jgi:hypothetical protein